MALPALKGRSARSQTEYNMTKVPYSYDDPLFAVQLQKIDMYMDYLEVSTMNNLNLTKHFNLWFVWDAQVLDDMCRQRFLCQVASSPKNYSPLYGIFKKQLRYEHH